MSDRFQTEAEYYAWAQQLTAALKAAAAAPADPGLLSTSTSMRETPPLERKDLRDTLRTSRPVLRHTAPQRIRSFGSRKGPR